MAQREMGARPYRDRPDDDNRGPSRGRRPMFRRKVCRFCADKSLMIDIKMRQLNNMVELIVRDNGKGLPENWKHNSHSLGMELINSLCEQIDGTHQFKNDHGLVFNLVFKV